MYSNRIRFAYIYIYDAHHQVEYVHNSFISVIISFTQKAQLIIRMSKIGANNYFDTKNHMRMH